MLGDASAAKAVGRGDGDGNRRDVVDAPIRSVRLCQCRALLPTLLAMVRQQWDGELEFETSAT